MTDMEISQAAIEAAEQAMRGHDCHEVVNANIPHLARVALAAAMPHLTYTASEVKVLTETATKVALALGRREALEEAAAKADELAAGVVNPDKPYNEAFIHACGVVARHIRSMAPQAADATSDATSGVPGHQEVSDMLGGSGEPPRRDATYPVDDDHPKHCLCPTCQEVSEAVRSPQERCGHPIYPCADGNTP